MDILIKKEFSHSDILKSLEAGGRKRGRVAGGWIADIAAQKKVILLCADCTHKFNPAKVNYRKEKEFPYCQGICDGCSAWDQKCNWYLYDEYYQEVRSTKDERRALMKSREARIKRGYL